MLRDVSDQPESGVFDDDAIVRLRLAAEEVAWLTGRGYPLVGASEFVSVHHRLSASERAALAHGTCSEPQYRRRAARELEAEDVARRPLSIDAADVLSALEAALARRPLLKTLDGTVRAFEVDRTTWKPGPLSSRAADLLFAAIKELRPSAVRFVVDEGQGEAGLKDLFATRAKAHKVKIEVVAVSDVGKALLKERQIVTGDAASLDGCAAWFNLVGRIVDGMTDAAVVRLQ